MIQPVDTKDRRAVENEVSSLYLKSFPNGDHAFVSKAFGWVVDSFQGRYKNYQAIDAGYHDLEHTLQGTLCMAQLLSRYHFARAKPLLTQRMFELGLLAILLHDTGYLKQHGDDDGTGAKYTLVHVDRSADFAKALLTDKGFPASEIAAVRHMICCTGVNLDLARINFGNDLERKTGFALGTADLLAQMAANDYIEKLPMLYSEFAESARFYDGRTEVMGHFTSALDLMQKSPVFWENYVLPKINQDFEGLYRLLNDPYPDGPNYYLKRIEANMDRLRRQLATAVSG